MERRLRTHQMAASTPFFTRARSGFLQRNCACGGTPGQTGECESCRKKRMQRQGANLSTGSSTKQPEHEPPIPAVVPGAPNVLRAKDQLDPERYAFTEPRIGHDFNRVRLHSELHDPSTPLTNTERRAAFSCGERAGGTFVDGPEKVTPKPTTPPPAQKPNAPSAKRPDCPTNVEVINIDPLVDTDFGKDGFLTGTGAVAYMEVSGSGSKDWDGTIIHETTKQTKNTCGNWARKVCSNESGESGGFIVGAKTTVLGQTNMTALRNVFYDMHIFALKNVSVLHQLDKPECQVQCQQSYQCGSKQFGPEFIITYMASKDTIAKTYDVTRIKVKKEAKVTPSTAPPPP